MATDGVQARTTMDAVLEQVEAALQRAEEAAGVPAPPSATDAGALSVEQARRPEAAGAAHDGLGAAPHRDAADATATRAEPHAGGSDVASRTETCSGALPTGDPDDVMRGLMQLIVDLLGPPDGRAGSTDRPATLAGLLQDLAQAGEADAPVGPAWFFEPAAWSDILSGTDGPGVAADPTGATDA